MEALRTKSAASSLAAKADTVSAKTRRRELFIDFTKFEF
jgi:hypothetical protein